MKVNKTVRCHNHSASTFCAKRFPLVALITRASLAFSCLRTISQLWFRINSLFHSTYHSLWGHETCLRRKRKILGQRKNWSQDLRRRLKRNFSKTRRKLWPTATRDRVYSYLYFAPLISLGFPQQNAEDLSINARWSSTRNTKAKTDTT